MFYFSIFVCPGGIGNLFQNLNFEVRPEEITVTFNDVKGVGICIPGSPPIGAEINRWAACDSRQSFFATDLPSHYWLTAKV